MDIVEISEIAKNIIIAVATVITSVVAIRGIDSWKKGDQWDKKSTIASLLIHSINMIKKDINYLRHIGEAELYTKRKNEIALRLNKEKKFSFDEIDMYDNYLLELKKHKEIISSFSPDILLYFNKKTASLLHRLNSLCDAFISSYEYAIRFPDHQITPKIEKILFNPINDPDDYAKTLEKLVNELIKQMQKGLN